MSRKRLALLSALVLLELSCRESSGGAGTSSAPPTSQSSAPSASTTPTTLVQVPSAVPSASSSAAAGAAAVVDPSSLAPANIRVVDVTVGAGLPIDLVKRIVRQNLSRMRACYEAASAKEPQLHGQVLLDFTVTLTGDVVSPRASGLTLKDPRLLSCLGRTLTGVSFPNPKGAPQNVNVILELGP